MTTTDRIYYTVPTDYTIGQEYATLDDAITAARKKQAAYFDKRPDALPGGIRAFVHVRACHAEPTTRIDTVIATYEVFANTVKKING